MPVRRKRPVRSVSLSAAVTAWLTSESDRTGETVSALVERALLSLSASARHG
jgi:hypothetical protein